jgi:hypothetical protein
MTHQEIIAHAQDIKRHAIPLWKSKKTVFPDLPPYQRWRECISLILDCYHHLGPQSFDSGRPPILL